MSVCVRTQAGRVRLSVFSGSDPGLLAHLQSLRTPRFWAGHDSVFTTALIGFRYRCEVVATPAGDVLCSWWRLLLRAVPSVEHRNRYAGCATLPDFGCGFSTVDPIPGTRSSCDDSFGQDRCRDTTDVTNGT